MAAQEFLCTVTESRPLTATVFQLGFSPDKKLDFIPGQFSSIIIPGAGPGGRDLRRAYSIASPPESARIELCVKRVEGGPGTTYLSDLKPGDTLKVVAPYGDFVYKPKPGRHACFVATGTGISPFRAMILSRLFRDQPPASSLCLFGVRDEGEILYQDALEGAQGTKWISCVTRPTEGWVEKAPGKRLRGRVTDYLRTHDAEIPWKDTDFYMCGSGAMIAEVKELLVARGFEKTAIHHEKYY